MHCILIILLRVVSLMNAYASITINVIEMKRFHCAFGICYEGHFAVEMIYLRNYVQ